MIAIDWLERCQQKTGQKWITSRWAQPLQASLIVTHECTAEPFSLMSSQSNLTQLVLSWNHGSCPLLEKLLTKTLNKKNLQLTDMKKCCVVSIIDNKWAQLDLRFSEKGDRNKKRYEWETYFFFKCEAKQLDIFNAHETIKSFNHVIKIIVVREGKNDVVVCKVLMESKHSQNNYLLNSCKKHVLNEM